MGCNFLREGNRPDKSHAWKPSLVASESNVFNWDCQNRDMDGGKKRGCCSNKGWSKGNDDWAGQHIARSDLYDKELWKKAWSEDKHRDERLSNPHWTHLSPELRGAEQQTKSKGVWHLNGLQIHQLKGLLRKKNLVGVLYMLCNHIYNTWNMTHQEWDVVAVNPL